MIIQTENLTKKFKTAEAVSLLNLTVEEGSIYGFLGPNGAGKTTTIRLLLGLIAPSAGEVLLFGQRLQRDRRQVLRNIGSLVETPSLYPHLTGKENLQVVTTLLHLPQERIGQVLHLVDLAQDAHRKVSEYSFGMKQRLGTALALVHQPRLLILDEPTNGLDPQGIREKNFILPICLAIAGAVMNIVAYGNVTYQKFSPWMYGLDMARILAKAQQTQPYFGWPLPVILAISIVGATLVTLLGCVEFARRDI